MSKVKTANSADRVYKKDEFNIFLKMLKKSSTNPVILGTWTQIAEDLGVDRDTILFWRTLPEARQLIKEAKAFALEQMQVAGVDDWRMWKDQAKMLNVDFKDRNIDVTSKGEKLDGLVIIKDNGDQTE